VLAGGQTFTVLRRESNLEVAMLDGALTGTLQIEGLRVGDIVDLAATLTRRDPVLMGHAERLAGLPGVTADRYRIRELWPPDMAMRWRETAGIDPPKMATGPDGTELLIDMANVKPPRPPKGAPARYANIGQLELTDFQSWSDLAALMAPLYDHAAALGPDSPLKAEAASIAAASDDPKIRAAAALKLVQDKIRYVFLGMNDGGYLPAEADLTWSRRFGDCKGKTAILLALLHELGIQAEPAVVSAGRGDGMDTRLPLIGLFDHILVRAAIAGKVYWLDGTRMGDHALDDIAIPPFKWALPIRASGAALEALVVPPFEAPQEATTVRFDASDGVDAPARVHAQVVFRGDAAIALKLQMANAARDVMETHIKDFFRKRYPDVDVQTVDFAFDEQTGEGRVSLDGVGKMSWTAGGGGARRFETEGVVGWRPEYNREPGQGQDAPFATAYPMFNRSTEIVVLPHGGYGFSIQGADIDRTLAGVELKRTARIDDGVFTLETSARSIAPEFPASEAADAGSALRALANDTVYLVIKAERSTEALAALDRWIAHNPTAEAYVERARSRGPDEHAQKLADIDSALKLDPKFAPAYDVRANLLLQDKDYDGAIAAIEAGIALSPDDSGFLLDRSEIYRQKGDYDQAIAGLDAILAKHPDDAVALNNRCWYRAIARRELDAARSDCDAALRLRPQDSSFLDSRALVALQAGRLADAIGDYDAALTINPKQAPSLFGRGLAKLRSGDGEAGQSDLAAARAADPGVEAEFESYGVKP
jgi:tetratricopeptide (TPR) repeat protein